MKKETYLVATIKSWNVDIFNRVISKYPGKWHLVTSPRKLTVELINRLKPKYIFFPHWNDIVHESILNAAECINFHETDLPYGRGGSPIQNLIANGHKNTMITALKMTKGLDAWPIYLKERLSLDGRAEEIFKRASLIVAGMIYKIITGNPVPEAQKGKIRMFKRRKPKQSEIPKNADKLEKIYDHIRMLDAEGYPKAFVKYGKYKIEFKRPVLKNGFIQAEIKISKQGEKK
jgi:methionyl-tRNA formyltransferase